MVVLDRPVLNLTSLPGRYVFSPVWIPDASQFPSIRQRPSPQVFEERDDLFTAMREQLGLKLEAIEVSVEVLVLDRANKPSGNRQPGYDVPGADERLTDAAQ